MRRKKSMILLLTAGLLAVSGCAASGAEASDRTAAILEMGKEYDFSFSERDLDPSYEEEGVTYIQLADDKTTISTSAGAVAENGAVINGSGAAYADGVLQITKEGTYLLSGSLSNGQILVTLDDTEKAQLVLDGVTVACENNAALVIEEGDKVFITLAEGSENRLESGDTYSQEAIDDGVNGTIFSRADLVFNGTGSLTVQAPYDHAIASKDDLKITGGDYTIKANGDGLHGKDCVKIAAGKFHIVAEGDGIQSDNDTDEGRGFVYIAGGDFNINAEGDGIVAAQFLQTDGGSFAITTGGGSENGEQHQEENNQLHRDFRGTEPPTSGAEGPEGPEPPNGDRGTRPDRKPDGADNNNGEPPAKPDGEPPALLQGESSQPIEQQTNAVNETAENNGPSQKGVKCDGSMALIGGQFTIDAADDSVHANGDIAVTGASLQLSTGDDGIHADGTLAVSGGGVYITQSYEGLEGNIVAISGGNISIVSSDDGINGANGDSTPGQQVDGDGLLIEITGGTVIIDAEGDGLDSNGTLSVTGGMVLVNGSVFGDNSALDYEKTGTISGGTVVAVGAKEMSVNFSAASGQASLLYNFPQSYEAGTTVTLCNSADQVILSFTPTKAYSSAVLSSPALKQGGTYRLYIGGSIAEADENGFADSGTLTGGTLVEEITLTDAITTSGVGGRGDSGGFGGGPGRGSEKPNRSGNESKM